MNATIASNRTINPIHLVNKRELYHPIEYYEAIAGKPRLFASYINQFAIRLDNEIRWQEREHEIARDDLRASRNR